MHKTNREPSLKLSFLIILLYLFAAIPLTFGIIYGLTILGYPIGSLKLYLSEIIIIAQIGITGILIFILSVRYLDYLFSHKWKKDFFLFLKAGFKWAIPLLILHALSLLIPIIRENLISRYLATKVISVRDASNITLSLFTVWLTSAAIFEEFFSEEFLLIN